MQDGNVRNTDPGPGAPPVRLHIDPIITRDTVVARMTPEQIRPAVIPWVKSLEAEHFVVLGGPSTDFSKHRAMLIVNAPNEQELRRRLDADPWMRTGVLRTVDIYPWEILLGKLP
jgi:uncharacterized protein YciI